jgi:hypothetical protein
MTEPSDQPTSPDPTADYVIAERKGDQPAAVIELLASSAAYLLRFRESDNTAVAKPRDGLGNAGAVSYLAHQSSPAPLSPRVSISATSRK